MALSFIIAVILLGVILSFEGWRRWTGKPLSALTVANIVFALNYCVSPIMLTILPGTDLSTGPFGDKLYILEIADLLKLDTNAYLNASMVSVYAYGVMVVAYLLMMKVKRPHALDANAISGQQLAIYGLVFGMISVTALLLYSHQFQAMDFSGSEQYETANLITDPFGIVKMMKSGNMVRGGNLHVSWGFLQIIVMLGVPAVIMLSASALRLHGVVRVLLILVALVVWLGVLSRAYHAAGRMELTVIIAIVPLAIVLGVRSIKAMLAGGGGLFVFGLFMVLAGHDFFPQPGKSAVIMAEALVLDTGRVVLFLCNEFAFPFLVSAHTINITPEVVGYRYFADVPLAILYMLPSFGGVDAWPEMISHIHERIVPLLLPYDLISFGYYSAGALGIFAVFAILGILLAVIDAWLVSEKGWLGRILLAAWMMYLPFRIMYADPYTSMKTGFGLIVGTVVVVMMVWMAKRWRQI